jgi:hypothetical protein
VTSARSAAREAAWRVGHTPQQYLHIEAVFVFRHGLGD